MDPRTRGRLRKALRYFVLGGLAARVLLAALSWAAVASLKPAIGRIEIDPGAFNPMIHESVLATSREGTLQQDLIAAFADAPAESIAIGRPPFEDATKDPDPGVSRAARQALDRIDPAKAIP